MDELPQLLNVVRGEMSLSGRAPSGRSSSICSGRASPATRTVTASSPASPAGRRCTGCAGQTSLADRVEWDNHYIENWSLGLDLKILVMTVAAVLRRAE